MEKQQFTYSIQPLLEEKEGNISGPMSPVLFAKEMASQVGFKYNRLARLWLADERINQCREDGGLTGHDTLIIGAVYKDNVWLSLWVDTGVGGVAVASAFRSDRSIDFVELYRRQPYVSKLSQNQITDIFQSIFNDPTQINIKS
jgi:methyl coenzyme M reductase alpha subunit